MIFCFSALAGETEENPPPRKKESASYCSRDASVLSMMGWGIGIFAGIATLFALLDNNPESE